MIIRVFEARLRPGGEYDFMAGERELLTRKDVDGLLGASIGRRITGAQVHVITLTVWRDREAIERFVSGRSDVEQPVYRPGSEALVETWTLTHYDAVDVPELTLAAEAETAGLEAVRAGAEPPT